MVHGLTKSKLIIWDIDVRCIIGNHCSMEKLNTEWKIMIAVIHVQNEIILCCKKFVFRAEENVSSLYNSTCGLVHMDSNHCLLCKKYSPWTTYDINGPPS